MDIKINNHQDLARVLRTKAAALKAITEIRDKLWVLSLWEASCIGVVRELDAAIDKYTDAVKRSPNADSGGSGDGTTGVADDGLSSHLQGQDSSNSSGIR